MSSDAYVQIIVGSESDLKPVKDSGMLSVLDGAGVSYQLSIISAHRNPNELKKFVEETWHQAQPIYIAAAGMAAALPGAIKSYCPEAVVIGVPLIAKDGFLSGLDAVLSMLRMPPGKPVIVSGVESQGLVNAAWVALDILDYALRPELVDGIREFRSGAVKEPQIPVKEEQS